MAKARLSRGSSNIRWIETYCRIPEGRFVGQPVRLRTWQKKEIRRIYDNPHGTRTAILSFARKNAKTSLAAFLLLLHLCGPEAVPNSQLFSTALSRDQAAVLFALAAKIVRMSPEISAVVGVRDSGKQLYCDELGTLYRALSADAPTAFGLSPVFVVHDELGQVRGERSQLFEAMETAAGAQARPLSIIISTQAPTDKDLLSILIDNALAGHDPRVVVSLYTAPPADDPFLVKTIKKANPAYGDFLNAEEVKRQADEARRMPAREAAFRNLVLNQRINQVSPFVAPSAWKACGLPPAADAFRRGRVRIGLDLSARHDLTALVYATIVDGARHVRAEFFAPRVGIDDRSLRDRVPYDLWAAQGYITATDGASVDYETVAIRLCELCDEYDVEAIAYDRWRMDVLKAELARLNVELPLVPFGQGFKDMTPALEGLESDLLNARLRHGNNPVLTMCAANAVVVPDDAGNRKLSKARSTGRIDGLVALAMTYTTTSVEPTGYWPAERIAVI